MNECEDDDCNGYAWYQQQLLDQQRIEEEEQQAMLKADPAYQRFLEQQSEQSLSYRTANELENEHGSR
jgi:hypothetical protein